MGIILGLIIAISVFVHTALRHNMYANLIPLWVIYVFATISCYLIAFSQAKNAENHINFISGILIVGIIAIIAAVMNGLEAYLFSQFYDTNYLSDMLIEAQENWKKHNRTAASTHTQWEQTLYKDPVNHGIETAKTMFFFNNVLGTVSFVMYFIRWVLKNSKKLLNRKS